MAKITLVEAGQMLNLSPSTLRHQIRRGYFKAEKRGRDWWTTTGEVERYRKFHAMDPERVVKYRHGPRKQSPTDDAGT